MKTLEELIGMSVKDIKHLLAKQDWDTTETTGYKQRSIYIGSSLNLAPSGKYYMPWSTNVSEEEAEADEDFWSNVDDILSENNLVLFSGEGDPLDTYIGEYQSLDENP